MSDEEDVSEPEQSLEERIARLERAVAALQRRVRFPFHHLGSFGSPVALRLRSETRILGLPLYDIAMGPDPEKEEIRGHAKGFFAVGDIATGIVAIGGFARGIIAIGGLALGIFSAGGAAVGTIALGGGAIGLVAIGGGAVGYYAKAGAALGIHVVDTMRQDPQAVQFFNKWFPGF